MSTTMNDDKRRHEEEHEIMYVTMRRSQRGRGRTRSASADLGYQNQFYEFQSSLQLP